jgi:hypothetical protein
MIANARALDASQELRCRRQACTGSARELFSVRERDMEDWNVIITVFQDGYRRALRALHELGRVERSPYHNVLVMKVDDPAGLLSAVETRTRESPALYDAISRVAPAKRTFDFKTRHELLAGAKLVIGEWASRLAGCRCYVRLHLSGVRQDLQTQEMERRLDREIVEKTTGIGRPASIAFTNPDAIIAFDAIDNRAGLALWTRDELRRYAVLRPD